MSNPKIGSGFWMYTTYQQCPRKFWFSKILCWEPEKQAPALSFGSAIHSGVQEFWTGADKDDVVAKFVLELTSYQSRYADATKYLEDMNRGQDLIKEYYDVRIKERDQYEVLFQEEKLIVNLQGYNFVFKPDRIVRNKNTNQVEIHEVKTTGYSLAQAHQKVVNSDQSTAYLYAWNKVFPNQPCETLRTDILYQRKSSIQIGWGGAPIYRKPYDLDEWAEGMVGIISDITQKVEALKSGKYSYKMLFPRRGDCDGDGFYNCEFKDICRDFLDLQNPPFGYQVKEQNIGVTKGETR